MLDDDCGFVMFVVGEDNDAASLEVLFTTVVLLILDFAVTSVAAAVVFVLLLLKDDILLVPLLEILAAGDDEPLDIVLLVDKPVLLLVAPMTVSVTVYDAVFSASCKELDRIVELVAGLSSGHVSDRDRNGLLAGEVVIRPLTG